MVSTGSTSTVTTATRSASPALSPASTVSPRLPSFSDDHLLILLLQNSISPSMRATTFCAARCSRPSQLAAITSALPKQDGASHDCGTQDGDHGREGGHKLPNLSGAALV